MRRFLKWYDELVNHRPISALLFSMALSLLFFFVSTLGVARIAPLTVTLAVLFITFAIVFIRFFWPAGIAVIRHANIFR